MLQPEDNGINADQTLALGSMRDVARGQSRWCVSGPQEMRLFPANLATGEITALLLGNVVAEQQVLVSASAASGVQITRSPSTSGDSR